MHKFDVRIAFPSGLVRSYLDFLLSFDYHLRALIPLKAIIKSSSASGILSTLKTQEMLTMKISYISQVLLLKICFK